MRCKAKSKRSGKQCKNNAVTGYEVCRMHGANPRNKGGAPKGSSNAEKHGLWRKHLPEETLKLVDELQEEDRIQKLKRSIAVQEAAIIRSQSIMHVEDKEEIVRHLKKIHKTPHSKLVEFEFEYPWHRQSNYLNALSRAMDTLMKMYKTLYELTNEDNHVKEAIGTFINALTGTAEEVWGDEDEEAEADTV